MTGVIGINIAIESNVRCLRLDGDASVNSSFEVSTDSSNGFCMGNFRSNGVLRAQIDRERAFRTSIVDKIHHHTDCRAIVE
eukprot:scaffold32701_cov99-Amphora_coffeaeformis.AAC.1